MEAMRTLILGLGNPILRDDAVGMVVARAVHATVASPDVALVEAAVAGLEALDIIAGYDRVIVIDAIQTAAGAPGDLHRLSPDDLSTSTHLTTPHDVDFSLALELGRHWGRPLPAEITIYAVEVADPYTFAEELSPEVAARVPEIVRTIVAREFDGRLAPPESQRRPA